MQISIGKPVSGWSLLILEDDAGHTFEGKLSYVDDVLNIFMRAFRVFLESDQPVAIKFNEEGSDYTIVLGDRDKISILSNKGDTQTVQTLNITAKDFIVECLNELEENLPDWMLFADFDGKYADHEALKYACECTRLEIDGLRLGARVQLFQRPDWNSFLENRRFTHA